MRAGCETAGCGRTRQVGQEVCSACWQRLTRAMRAAIMAAHRGGRIHDRAALGREARAWLGQSPNDRPQTR
jgi:hypothetical protein